MRNWLIILFVFVVPMGIYGLLSNSEQFQSVAKEKAKGAVVYKFSTPMCSECKNVEKMLEGMPQKYTVIEFKEINVAGTNSKGGKTKALIEKYDITTVPTLVFVDVNGNVYEKLEVDMTREQIENNLKGISTKK